MGKIYFTIDWYNKNTTKLLYNVPVSLSSGIPQQTDPIQFGVQPGSVLENIGAVRNRGLDIAIGYNGKIGKVNYSIGGTGSFNTIKVLTLDGSGVTSFLDPAASNAYPGAGNTNIWDGKGGLSYTGPGLPFGQFWGLRVLGIYKPNDPRLATAPTIKGTHQRQEI